MNAPPWVRRLARSMGRLRGSAVVVAVSGGGDSVGLLRALHSVAPGLEIPLSVAHLDHAIRGEGGRADARFVADLAGALGLPVDLGEWTPTRPNHFEADARRARYDWLAGVARSRGAGWVATGHTLDDQAETVLHRVIRGTGLRGLAGIPPRRPLAEGLTLIRPLLGVTRLEIRDYLATIGQGFRDDPTNADLGRTRARIRLDLLPKLAEEYNPAVAEALARLGRLASGANRSLDRRIRGLARGVVVESGPARIVLDRPKLARLDPFDRAEVIRFAWNRAGWPEGTMDARRWARLAADGAIGSVGSGVEATSTLALLILDRLAKVSHLPPSPVPLSIPGSADWSGGRVVATYDADRDESVDLDRLIPPLVVRGAEPGDRFDPLGLDGHTRPLADFFRGARVARSDRESVPIVCDRAGIVWVVGHRIAHRVRSTEGTGRTLGLRYEP